MGRMERRRGEGATTRSVSTTREPDESQVEVGMAALDEVIRLEAMEQETKAPAQAASRE